MPHRDRPGWLLLGHLEKVSGGLEIHSVDKSGGVALSEDIHVSFWRLERSWDVLRMASSLI